MDIKQVIVMRTDLNMRKGKMIAQGAHAAMMFLTKRLAIDHGLSEPDSKTIPMFCKLSNVELIWTTTNFKKICVRVDSEEELLKIHQAAQNAGLESHLCTDSGLTEFAGIHTNTAIAIGPDEAEKIDKITGLLKPL